MDEQPVGVTKKKKDLKLIALVILILIFVASIASAYYFYQQFSEIKKNPQKIAQEEVRKLVKKVGQLIVLPEGEEPTVATVNDPELLKDQLFFANAKQGFKVLIYTNAKKAILYDPVNNIIVEVAPISIGTQTEGTSTPSQ